MIVALFASLVYAAPGALLATHEETLPSGLRVVGHQMAHTDLVTVRLELPRGAAEDPPGRAGLAHLVEHVSYVAAAGERDNAYDLALAAVGGTSAGATTHDALAFSVTVPSEALPFALELERRRLAPVAPSPEGLARQLAVVARERAERARAEGVRAGLAAVLWPAGHPYAHTVLGSPDALAEVAPDELHAAARALFRLDGAVLVLVGPGPAEALVAEARRWFGGEGTGPHHEASGAATARLSAPPDESLILGGATDALLERAPGELAALATPAEPVRAWLPADVWPTRLRVAWRTVPWDHADAAALDLVAGLLADALRDDDTDVAHWAGRLGGSLLVAADTERPAAALARVERAVRRLARRGPTDAALARVRARARTRELAALDTPEGRAELLAAWVTRTGAPDCLPGVWAARERVDRAAVRQVTHRWLADDVRVVLAAAPWDAPLPRMARVEPR